MTGCSIHSKAVQGGALIVALGLVFQHPGDARAASNGVTADEVVTALASEGLPVDLGEDFLGDPEIDSSIGDTPFSILFFDCAGEVCQSIIFSAFYFTNGEISLDTVNDWNNNNIFGQAYIDEDNDPALDMAVSASGGISVANLRHNVRRWREAVEEFEDHIGWIPNRSEGAAVASGPVSIEVCNDSGSGVSLAFATAAGRTNNAGDTLFRSEGWLNLEHGDCTDVWESPFENRYYYIYAEATDGEYSGDYFFCTLEDAFEIVDTQCSAEYERNGFIQIDMDIRNRYQTGYTMTLDP